MSSLAQEDLPTISSSRHLACEWQFAKCALKGDVKTLTYKYIFVVLLYIRGFITLILYIEGGIRTTVVEQKSAFAQVADWICTNAEYLDLAWKMT